MVSPDPPWLGDCLGGDGRAADDNDGRRALLLGRLGSGVGVTPPPRSPVDAAPPLPPPLPPAPDGVVNALVAGVRTGAGDSSAPAAAPPASGRVDGGVGVRDRLLGPTLLRSADAEPAEARFGALREEGTPGPSIIMMGVGLTVLLRIRVTRSLVTGPFLESNSLELTSPTCRTNSAQRRARTAITQTPQPRMQAAALADTEPNGASTHKSITSGGNDTRKKENDTSVTNPIKTSSVPGRQRRAMDVPSPPPADGSHCRRTRMPT